MPYLEHFITYTLVAVILPACCLEPTQEDMEHLQCLRYLESCTLFAEGLNQMHEGLKVSQLLIANMILFVNFSNYINQKLIHIMTFT